jgi:hypothetical protein
MPSVIPLLPPAGTAPAAKATVAPLPANGSTPPFKKEDKNCSESSKTGLTPLIKISTKFSIYLSFN